MTNYSTPGVYIEEKNAFGTSVPAIATAVTAFVGYTEKAEKNNKSLTNLPTRITSIEEFETLFGGRFQNDYLLEESDKDGILFESVRYKLIPNHAPFYLYDALKQYFINGGKVAFIVSVGNYTKDGEIQKVNVNRIGKGFEQLKSFQEPTLLVAVDQLALEAKKAQSVHQKMLAHCAGEQNRFSILDVPEGNTNRYASDVDAVENFREGIGNVGLAYGAVYYPWIETVVYQSTDFTYENFGNIEKLQELLLKEAESIHPNKKAIEEVSKQIQKISKDGYDEALHFLIQGISPLYNKLLEELARTSNIQPTAGSIAGMMSRVDDARGVWKAPANEGLVGVSDVTFKMNNQDQEDLNVNLFGKSINAIRNFKGEGVLVWGARTLDGNSQDWKYVNVRRTMIFLEQSIKNAIKRFVFEPNTALTWLSVKSSIETFLTEVWRAGGVVGAIEGQAFQVNVGLGSTMSPQDVLEGKMKISVKVAVSRPAEFIVITFEQKVQES
ncbi:phage tail sheath family protein [Flammeovirga pacifica]|uniref:Phage tail protein n=1 Tax=Flammeovirga pacifica TaxID=915059 RepID=A0A1S1YVB1_FLAPC|nr:phage tail sheath C-terminal domain-containing protein [Flammeovirga pacifica]OHX64961.1 hypothetical protein NH26_00660 [Flammeovirga pacifica]